MPASEWIYRRFPGRRARRSVLVVVACSLGLLLWAGHELNLRHDWAVQVLAETAPRHARLDGLLRERERIQEALVQSRNTLIAYAYPAGMAADRVATDLLQRVSAVADAAGASVINSRILPVSEMEHFNTIAVNVTVVADAAGLRDLLGLLAGEEPRILLVAPRLEAARRPGTADVTAHLNLSSIHLR